MHWNDTLRKLLTNSTLINWVHSKEHSDRVPDGRSSHTLLLSGMFRGGIPVLCQIRMALDPVDLTVTINLVVRYGIGNFTAVTDHV